MLIKLADQVPSIYTNASRDFQYLSWLIDIVLNSVKHNVDDIYDLPNAKDSRLTELLALTFGFKIKRNYDQKQLTALVSIIPTILKYKGTEKAITIALDALITASGVYGDFSAENDNFCKVENNVLELTIPKGLIDTTLFMDLLPYILPAGMTCKIARKTQLHEEPSTRVANEDKLYAKLVNDLSWNVDKQVSEGLANMYDSGIAEFSNFTNASRNSDSQLVLNQGLLANTVIPVLDNTLLDTKSEQKDEEI